MANIFENVAKAVTSPFGSLEQGVMKGMFPGYVQQVQRQRQQQDLIADIEKIRAAGGTATEAGRKMLAEMSGKYTADMFRGAGESPYGKIPGEYTGFSEQERMGLVRQDKQARASRAQESEEAQLLSRWLLNKDKALQTGSVEALNFANEQIDEIIGGKTAPLTAAKPEERKVYRHMKPKSREEFRKNVVALFANEGEKAALAYYKKWDKVVPE